jgi:Family of unknown function (DUF5678)
MKTGAARRLDPDSQAPTPETFLAEIQAIFNSGTLRGAREVAERGLALFPDHPELRRLHHALRPYEVRSIPGKNAPDRRETYEWLRQNAEKYKGQWVAVLGGHLVAASPQLARVIEEVDRISFDAPPLLHFLD